MATAVKCKLMDKIVLKRVLDSIDTILTDCDGVLYHGSKAVPGAADAVKKLKNSGKRFFYVTNNSTKTRKEFVKKLTDLGFPAVEDDVIGSGYVTAETLKNKYKFQGKAYVLGSPSLAEELSKVGITAVGIGPDVTKMKDLESFQPDREVTCVVNGLDEHFNYVKAGKAATYLNNKDCLFVATNTDSGLPVADGRILPGAGSQLAMVTTASQRNPDIICGKPHQPMFDVLVDRYQLVPEKTLMIGDRLDTDILLAGRCSLQSLLVLTGFSTLDEVQRKQTSHNVDEQKQVPMYYIQSLADISNLLDEL